MKDEVIIQKDRVKGRLLRFLFNPPSLGARPPAWMGFELAAGNVCARFARRLAKHPPDLVTRLGMIRSNAYYRAGCPAEVCDQAAARDLWRVIYQEAIGCELVAGHGNR